MATKLVHITDNDIEQVTDLAADCFVDDPFFEPLSKNRDKRKEKLKATYRECIGICVKYGSAIGHKENEQFISFILYFNYHEIKIHHPNEYKFIFEGNKYTRKINKSLQGELKNIDNYLCDNWEYLYLLAIGVKEEYRRKGYAENLVEVVKQTFPNYNLFTDTSNLSSRKLCEKLKFENKGKAYGCTLLSFTQQQQIKSWTQDDTVWLAVPSELKAKNLGISVLAEEIITQKHIQTISGVDPYFRYNPCTNSEVRIIKISYTDLMKYHRYINDIQFDEINIQRPDKLVLIYVTNNSSFPGLVSYHFESEPYKHKMEWEIIPDVYTSIPIQYNDIKKIRKNTENNSLIINRILKFIDLRTKFDAGIPVENFNSNRFRERIERYYLGRINVQLCLVNVTDFQSNNKEPDRIGNPVEMEMIVSIDKETQCGILHLVTLSGGFLITHYLDSVSRNEIFVLPNEPEKNSKYNLYEYLKDKFEIEKKGSARNFLTVPEERKYFDGKEHLLASILFCEAVFEGGDYLSKVIDKNIMGILSDSKGIAQYNYAGAAYIYNNILIQFSKSFQTGIYERIKMESVTLFYIELVLFEISAIQIANDKIIKLLAEINDKHKNSPRKVLHFIDTILSNHVQSIEFWDIPFNYPSTKEAVENIRRGFSIENEKIIFERNEKELLMIYDMRSDFVDKGIGMFISFIMLILAIISAVSAFSSLKDKSLFITIILNIIVVGLYLSYLLRNILYKNNFVKKFFKKRGQ